MTVSSFAYAAILALITSSPSSSPSTQPSTQLVADAGTTPKTDKDKIVDKVKPAAVDDVAEIAGYYTCKGQEAGGKNYNGVAVITKKGDVYLVQWMIGTGSTFSGLGIRQGNTLAVSWAIPNERGLIRGVNMYRIESGPRLSGRWATVPGPGVLQSETLTFLKGLDEEE